MKLCARLLGVIGIALTLIIAPVTSGLNISQNVVPIGEVARINTDASLAHVGQTVVIVGKVTVVASTARYTRFFVQDSSGAISFFARNQFNVREGDIARISGKVADYLGTPEVIPERVQVLRHGEPAVPIEMSLDRALRSENRCRLVRIKGRVVDAHSEADGTWLFLSANPVPVLLRLPREMAMPTTEWRAGTIVRVTGVIATRRHSGIRLRQIIPRNARSISIISSGGLNARTLLIVAMILGAVGLVSILWVISLRMRVAAVTRDLLAQRKLEEAHELARMGTWELDVATGVVQASSELYVALAIDPAVDSMLLAEFLELVQPDDRLQLAANIDAAVLDGKPFSMDARVTGRDGTERTLFLRGQAVKEEGGATRLIGVAQDVTEQRETQRRAEQEQRLAAVGTLAASLAHEFNNVLMSIQSVAETIERRSADEVALVAVRRIQSSVSRGKAVSERILRFTRPAIPMTEPVDVRAFLHALEPELRQALGENIVVDFVTSGESAPEGLWISADSAQLSQAFLTLAVNAREAMPEGGTFRITARRAISHTSSFAGITTPDRFVHFIIEDTGTGMDPVTLQRAFEPLYTTKRTGTGLGLPVVRQIVTLHSGHIYIESTPGRGTRIHLFIPGDVPPVIDSMGTVLRARSRRNILLVEDEPMIAEAISMLLEEEGMEVTVEHTGGDALNRMQHHRPDVVVLDIGLPDMSGLDVYERIRAQWPDLPVVLSTGHGEGVGEPAGKKLVRLLRKPYQIEELLDVIESLTDAG